MNNLTIAPSPHIRDGAAVRTIMRDVVIALIPALLVSGWVFGLRAWVVTLVAVAACLLFEFLIQKFILKRSALSICDFSAVVTGILLAFNLPSSLPLWMVVVGALVAIAIAKMSFGGLGKNLFNPALVARVFLLISFPVPMTVWPLPQVVDGTTGPTLLSAMREGLKQGVDLETILSSLPSYTDLLLGTMGGSLGEVSALALGLGAIYLLIRRVITWHIPVSFLLTVVLFAAIFWQMDPHRYANPLIHVLSGGILLGAFFMATDMVTSPMTPKGMLIFGMGCGLLTMLIRLFGAYPEGVSFAILLMNAVTPLINRTCKPKRFGGPRL